MVSYNSYPKETDRLIGSNRSSMGGGASLLENAGRDDRHGFVRKVYGIITAQLTFTFGAIFLTKASPDTNDWIKHQHGLAIAAVLLALIP